MHLAGFLSKQLLMEGEGARAAIWQIFPHSIPFGTFPKPLLAYVNYLTAPRTIGLSLELDDGWTALPGPRDSRLCHFCFFNAVENGIHFRVNSSLEMSSDHFLRMWLCGASSLSSNWIIKLTLFFISRRPPHSATLEN